MDVLTPLSDCRQESVEKMEQRILGVSYLYWIWSSGTTFTAYCCSPGMSLQRVFVLWIFVCSANLSLFSGYHAEGYHAPPIPYGYHAEGYHARTDTFKLAGYHVCRLSHPSYHAPYKLLGTGGISHLRVVFSYFSFHRRTRRCFHNNNHNFPTEPGEHRTGTHNRTGDKFGRETAMFFLRRHRRGTLCYHLLQNSICELGCCPGRHSLRFWIYRLGGGCR